MSETAGGATTTFWGYEGRIALIHAGRWQGCVALAYPETRPEWYTLVVAPFPTPGVDRDYYVEGADEMAFLEAEGEFQWLPVGPEEAQLEKEMFGWRPLFSPFGLPGLLTWSIWAKKQARKRNERLTALSGWAESDTVRAIFPKRI